MKKSDCAIGEYINVFHPYDSKLFDVFVIINEANCQLNDTVFDKIINFIQPVIETAWETKATKEFLHNYLYEGLESFDELGYGFQIVIANWNVNKN